MTKARKKLAEVEDKLAQNAHRQRDLAARYAAAKRRVEDLQRELRQMYVTAAVDTAGVPLDEDVRKLETELAAAEAAVESRKWSAEREGLRQAKETLEAERLRIATENFDTLAGELADEAKTIGGELVDVFEAVAVVEDKWKSIAQAWLALERAAGMSRHTRLDVPAFPLKRSGDASALPVPAVLTSGDPTIRSAA